MEESVCRRFSTTNHHFLKTHQKPESNQCTCTCCQRVVQSHLILVVITLYRDSLVPSAYVLPRGKEKRMRTSSLSITATKSKSGHPSTPTSILLFVWISSRSERPSHRRKVSNVCNHQNRERFCTHYAEGRQDYSGSIRLGYRNTTEWAVSDSPEIRTVDVVETGRLVSTKNTVVNETTKSSYPLDFSSLLLSG